MTMTHPSLILGSSSPARLALLQRLQIPFTQMSPDVDETALPGEKAEDLVLRLAKAKACAIPNTDALIIGCDQVGVLDNTILCKPLTHEKAAQQLRLMSNQRIRFLTGLCLLDTRNNHYQLALETYDVYFRSLSDEMIEAYLQKEKPLHCAGSFQAEGLGITLISKFQGDDYTALIGLPLIRLVDMLSKIGPN